MAHKARKRVIADATVSLAPGTTVDQGAAGADPWKVDDDQTQAKLDTVITALGTLLTTTAFQTRINTLGQKASANSTPVVLSSEQEAILGLLATAAKQNTGNASLASIDSALGSIFTELVEKTEPANQQHAIIDSSALPSGASTEATLAAIKAKTDNLDVALSTRLKAADTLAGVTTLTTITNPVGIKGVDGSGIASAANPVPVAAKQAAAEMTTSQLLSSAPLSKVTAQTSAFRLVSVGIKFSASVSQTVQVKFTSTNGTNYDFILDSTALVNQTSYFAFWDNLVFANGAQITVTCTNTGTPAVTAYLTITTVPV